MDVFLVPVAPDRYELYCEEPDEPEPPADEGTPRPGLFRRMALWFREQLAEAELARRHGPQPGDARRSFLTPREGPHDALGGGIDCRTAPPLAAARQGRSAARLPI